MTRNGILLGVVFALAARMAAAEPLSINASDFSLVPPDSAHGDECSLLTAGQLMMALNIATNSTYTFVVVGRGEPAAGEWPLMDVRMDGDRVTSLRVKTTNWASYAFSRDLTEGRHELVLSFANDAATSNEDRNLHIANLTVIPTNDDITVDSVSASEYRREQKAARAELAKKNDAQIERIRKGDLAVTVLDAAGKPIPDAQVTVEETRQEFLFGGALCTAMFKSDATNAAAATYRDTVKKYFNHAVTGKGLTWPDMEPMRDVVLYDDIDRMANWCRTNGITLRGHALFWSCHLPDWAPGLSDDDLRTVIARRARNVVGHYQGLISEFDVNNEMLHCKYLNERLGDSITRQMFAEAEGANPYATLYVNDYGILEGQELARYADQIRNLREIGVPVGGIGLQAHFTGPVDILQIQKALDTLSQFGLPIKITEFDCSNDDERVQAQVLEDVYRVAYAHPAVEGILAWNVWATCGSTPSAALLRADFSKTAAADRYEKLVLGNWRTRAEGETDSAGTFTCRAFYGSYAIRARLPDGTTLATNAAMAKSIGRLAVTLGGSAPAPAKPAAPVAEKKPAPAPVVATPTETPATRSAVRDEDEPMEP